MYIGIKIPEHHLHHVTLAFLGKSGHDTLGNYKRAAAAVSAAAVHWAESIVMEFGETEKFPEGPWYAPVDSWQLELFRSDYLLQAMQYYNVEFLDDYEYNPHVTLSYWPKKPANPYVGERLEFEKVTLYSNAFGQTDFWL